jgi:hypothetical protein
VLGERAQEKTTPPPTLGKETIEVNHYQRSQKTLDWIRTVKRLQGRRFKRERKIEKVIKALAQQWARHLS